MINVLEVSSDSNIGGAGKCILTFLKEFKRDEFNVSLVVPRGSLLTEAAKDLDITVYEADHLAEKSLDINGIRELKKLFKELKPDLVHTHASMSARIAAKMLNIPIVYTRHSVFPPSKRISQGIGKAISGFVNNHTADKVIAVAEAAKDNLIAIGVDEKKTEVILNGVFPISPLSDEEYKAARERLGLSDEKAVGIVARLNPVKGHKYFVETAKILKERKVNAKFFIAGTGEEEENIKRQIKDLGLDETVICLGFLDDVRELMNVIDVQVNCSFGTEATSLSLLEGMSLGKPAVVTDFGGNPGVIQDGVNGYLVPKQDAKAMADALEKLLSDDDCYRRLSDNCIRIYEEKFTAAANARRIENIYRAVYRQKGGKR